MFKLLNLILIIMGLTASQHVVAQQVFLSDTYLDMQQASAPNTIPRNSGWNVTTGKHVVGKVQHAGANTSTALQPLKGIMIDPHIGGYNVTNPNSVCGPRCLGNQWRVLDATEIAPRNGVFSVAPQQGPRNKIWHKSSH